MTNHCSSKLHIFNYATSYSISSSFPHMTISYVCFLFFAVFTRFWARWRGILKKCKSEVRKIYYLVFGLVYFTSPKMTVMTDTVLLLTGQYDWNCTRDEGISGIFHRSLNQVCHHAKSPISLISAFVFISFCSRTLSKLP